MSDTQRILLNAPCYRCLEPCQRAPTGQMSVCGKCLSRGWGDNVSPPGPRFVEAGGGQWKYAC